MNPRQLLRDASPAVRRFCEDLVRTGAVDTPTLARALQTWRGYGERLDDTNRFASWLVQNRVLRADQLSRILSGSGSGSSPGRSQGSASDASLSPGSGRAHFGSGVPPSGSGAPPSGSRTDSGPRTPPQPGRLEESARVGPYEILGELGRGGMGVVYRARHAERGETVALKVLPRDMADRHVERFRREMHAAWRLRHPNIVRVTDSGFADGYGYYAMELVRGPSFEDWVAERPPLQEALAVVRDLALGLHHAHEKGVVHRDIKPENILFDEEKNPRITDFGLAKARGDEHLTRTGQLLGTPFYMSPEQARGEAKSAGPASDQFSLGVLLYEVLAGRRPFEADTSLRLMREICEVDPPPLRDLCPELPEDVERIVRKALEKEPEDRFEDCRTLAIALDRHLEGRTSRFSETSYLQRLLRSIRRRPLPWLGGAAALLLLLVGLTLLPHLAEQRALDRKLANLESRASGLVIEAEKAAERAWSRGQAGELEAAFQLLAETDEELDAFEAKATTLAKTHPARESAVADLLEQARLPDARGLLHLGRARIYAIDSDRTVRSAIEAAERATEVAPDLTEAWKTLGRLRLRRGETNAARQALDRAIEQDENDPDLRIARARANLELDRPRLVLSDLETLEESRARTEPVLILRAAALRRTGDPAAGIELLQTRVEKDRPSATILSEWARCRHAAGQSDVALTRLSELVEKQATPALLVARARLQRLRSAPRLAREDIARALAAMDNPDPGLELFRLECEELFDMNRLSVVTGAWTLVGSERPLPVRVGASLLLERHADSPDLAEEVTSRLPILRHRALQTLHDRDLERAIRLFTRARKLHPWDRIIREGQAFTHYLKEEYEAARNLADEVLWTFPKAPTALLIRGNARKKAGGAPGTDIEKAIRLRAEQTDGDVGALMRRARFLTALLDAGPPRKADRLRKELKTVARTLIRRTVCPIEGQLWLLRGQTSGSDQEKETLERARALVRLAPGILWGQRLLRDRLARLDRPREALVHARKAVEISEKGTDQEALARLLLSTEQYRDALEACGSALGKTGSTPELLRLQAHILDGLRRSKAAKAARKRAGELEAAAAKQKKRSRELVQKGLSAYEREDYYFAQEHFEKAIRLGADGLDVHQALGMALHKQTKALARNMVGMQMLLRTDDPHDEEWISDYLRKTHTESNIEGLPRRLEETGWTDSHPVESLLAQSWGQLLVTLYRKETPPIGKRLQTVANLDRVVRARPLAPAAYAYRGLAYFRAGYPERAREDWIFGARLFPDFLLFDLYRAIYHANQGGRPGRIQALELLEEARENEFNFNLDNLLRPEFHLFPEEFREMPEVKSFIETWQKEYRAQREAERAARQRRNASKNEK